jgi:hypothetical protein
MKKTILSIASLALFNSGWAQCSGSPTFYDDYSSAIGWTTVDKTNHSLTPNVKINAGKMVYTNLIDSREQRMVKQLPFTLDNKFWVSECSIKMTGGNGPAHLVMSFTENNNDTWYTQSGTLAECSAFAGTVTNQDAIYCYIAKSTVSSSSCCPQNSDWKIFAGYKDGSTDTPGASTGISVPSSGTTYYVRLQRTDYSVGVISVFSNSAMTNHVSGSPQCFTINPATSIADLKYVQHGANTGGNCNRKLSAEIDDLRIYNGISPCPLSLTPSFTMNSVVCSGNPVIVNGSASSSGTAAGIADHVWIVQECTSTGGSVPGAPEWWSPFIIGAPGSYTIPSAASGGPTMSCGKYYKVSLVLQNCGNIWAPTSKIVYIECLPLVTLTADDESLCYGTGTTLHAAVTGTPGVTYIYNWYQISPTFATLALNSSNNYYNVTPSVTTTYSASVVSSNGCSAASTSTVTVLSNSYSKNLTTGYDNASSSATIWGMDDDEWMSISSPINSSINLPAIAVTYAPNPAYNPGTIGSWITSAADGGTPDDQHAANPYSGHYIYENNFTLPSNYSYTLTINKFAADNDGTLYLDGTPVISLNPSAPSSNYMVGSTSPVYVSLSGGSHVLRADIMQYDRYTDFFAEVYITGTCAEGRQALRQPGEGISEVISNVALVTVYPNPSMGLFTIELNKETKAAIEIYDVLGKRVKFYEQTTLKSIVDLTGFPKGIYMINIVSEGKLTSKKIIIE